MKLIPGEYYGRIYVLEPSPRTPCLRHQQARWQSNIRFKNQINGSNLRLSKIRYDELWAVSRHRYWIVNQSNCKFFKVLKSQITLKCLMVFVPFQFLMHLCDERMVIGITHFIHTHHTIKERPTPFAAPSNYVFVYQFADGLNRRPVQTWPFIYCGLTLGLVCTGVSLSSVHSLPDPHCALEDGPHCITRVSVRRLDRGRFRFAIDSSLHYS